MLAKRVRDTFPVEDTIVTAIPSTALTDGTSQDRYRRWKRTVEDSSHDEIEYLVPRIALDVVWRWPEHLTPRGSGGRSAADLTARVDELGPWSVPFQLDHGVVTMDQSLRSAVAEKWFLYRLDLINRAVATLLGGGLADTSVLDIGCNCGLFSLDLAGRGVRRVDGVDLRPNNIAQARFLAENYGITNATFEVGDADDIPADAQWDVVLNLGVLYHVLNPFELIRRSYELCRSFAVIDTVCHTEPVSGYFVMGDKDVNDASEGKETYELHPTYRAVIDTIRYAGFAEIFEVVGRSEKPHPLYASGNRRCFLAVK